MDSTNIKLYVVVFTIGEKKMYKCTLAVQTYVVQGSSVFDIHSFHGVLQAAGIT